MNYWDQIRSHLQTRVSAESYENWLKSARFDGVDGRTLLITVPDQETRTWLETEYASLIHNAIHELGLPLNAVSYAAQPERLARVQAATAGDGGSHEVE